jgi:hypothetical protein
LRISVVRPKKKKKKKKKNPGAEPTGTLSSSVFRVGLNRGKKTKDGEKNGGA